MLVWPIGRVGETQPITPPEAIDALQLEPAPEQQRYERWLRLKQSRALPVRLFRRLGGRRLIKRQLKRTRIHGDWVFPGGGSGPFGDETLGAWQDFEQFTRTLAHFQEQRAAGRPSLFWDERSYSFWADLHARHG